jgi:hypothetical protein
MSIVKGVTIQDLHFGHKRSEEMYNELRQFKDFLNNNEVHILNINGDYFDRKLVGTEPSTFYALTFFSELVEICERKNIKLRVLLGTRSHDLNQVSTMFQHYLSRPTLDFKYIPTIQEEEILGLKVLYIPEEYPENGEEYYKPFKTNHYNIIHGHGTWDFVSFTSGDYEENSKVGIHSAPVFVYEEWKRAIHNGFAIFGHIHKRQQFKNVYYSGSYTAWGYGDRSKKGFTYYEVDTETKKWKFEYKDNIECPRFDTVSVKELFDGKDLNTITFEDIQKALNEEITKTDNLRIDLAGISDDKIKMFRKSFENNSKVKIEVKKAKALLTESTEPAIYEKYGYILKRELPVNETVQKFIKEEYQSDLEVAKIEEILKDAK